MLKNTFTIFAITSQPGYYQNNFLITSHLLDFSMLPLNNVWYLCYFVYNLWYCILPLQYIYILSRAHYLKHYIIMLFAHFKYILFILVKLHRGIAGHAILCTIIFWSSFLLSKWYLEWNKMRFSRWAWQWDIRFL